MKIKTLSGNEIDTDKISDREAAIIEAVNAFYKVCEQYNVTMVTRVVIDNKKYVGGQTTAKYKSKKRVKDQALFLLDTLAKFVDETTEGQVAMFRVKDKI